MRWSRTQLEKISCDLVGARIKRSWNFVNKESCLNFSPISFFQAIHDFVLRLNYFHVALSHVVQLPSVLFNLFVLLNARLCLLVVQANLARVKIANFFDVLKKFLDAVLLEEHFHFCWHLLVDLQSLALHLTQGAEISGAGKARLTKNMAATCN